jgi:hypothetical protein
MHNVSDERAARAAARPEPPRLRYGMEAIADFYGMDKRKAYGLANQGRLPGVFQIGDRMWAMEEDVALEGIRSKALGTIYERARGTRR